MSEAELIKYWREQARVLTAASRDDGMTDEQRHLSIGTAKGLRFCAKQLMAHAKQARYDEAMALKRRQCRRR